MGMVFALSVCSGFSGEVYVYVGRVWVGGCGCRFGWVCGFRLRKMSTDIFLNTLMVRS